MLPDDRIGQAGVWYLSTQRHLTIRYLLPVIATVHQVHHVQAPWNSRQSTRYDCLPAFPTGAPDLEAVFCAHRVVIVGDLNYNNSNRENHLVNQNGDYLHRYADMSRTVILVPTLESKPFC